MQCIQEAWGHTAHHGWARLLLNRARDLINHGPAHSGANGSAMPTDEGDQDGHFSLTTPRGGGLLRCLGARSHFYCCLDPTPTEGGNNNPVICPLNIDILKWFSCGFTSRFYSISNYWNNIDVLRTKNWVIEVEKGRVPKGCNRGTTPGSN